MNKVAVIWAGIIGVCIAHFLRKNGNKVILYDQYEPVTQTSFGNAGILEIYCAQKSNLVISIELLWNLIWENTSIISLKSL